MSGGNGWSFTALGTPAPQGSKKGFILKGAGGRDRVIITDANRKTKPWRQAVIEGIPEGYPKLVGAVAVYMALTMPRPKAARKSDRTPSTRPDVSKLARAVEDSITDAGLWGDDGQITEYMRLAKVWTDYDPAALEVPGVLVAAIEMTDDDWADGLIDLVRDALAKHRQQKEATA
jgi:Holliday junction resolvase RusA-like endonuclease